MAGFEIPVQVFIGRMSGASILSGKGGQERSVLRQAVRVSERFRAYTFARHVPLGLRKLIQQFFIIELCVSLKEAWDELAKWHGPQTQGARSNCYHLLQKSKIAPFNYCWIRGVS